MKTTPSAGKAATRADVARLAGVSTAVVSYVVNDGPRQVAPQTRERVLHAINQLHYRPNASARALKTGSSKMLGVVVPSIVNPFHAEFVDYIDRAASKAGYSLMLAATREDPEREGEVFRSLIDRRVDGLIVLAFLFDTSLYALDYPLIPRVMMERSVGSPGQTTLGPDELAGGQMATEHLLGHGHSRIAMIMGHQRRTDRRREGWEGVLSAHGLSSDLFAETAWSRHGGYRGANELLDRDDPPTAFFCASDLIAVGALQAIRERGMRVPEDIAVVCYDGTTESAYAWPPLTVVQQPFLDMAGTAVGLIESGDATRETHETFPVELVIRESCGCHLDGETTALPDDDPERPH